MLSVEAALQTSAVYDYDHDCGIGECTQYKPDIASGTRGTEFCFCFMTWLGFEPVTMKER